ncbi:MAG: hypothetical protein M1453_12525 [Acidobacteria bacterium]|nr:hypothetical protein [Acidobacteriota bacterium]MCL5288804.1 hypothetical protein [Acidobacteriota bacterium]
MPDFRQLVRERLGALGLAPQLEAEVVAELAAHLDDRFAAGVRSGMTEPEAVAMALDEVPDWVALNQEISAAKKDGPMNERTRSLWLPGMTMMITAAILMSAALRFVPPVAWLHPNAPLFFLATWLPVYGAFGALGAYWSRRAGGGKMIRFLAGVFPVALHLAIFICVVIAANLQNYSRTPEYQHLGFQLRVFLSFVVVPGIALAAGSLPFMRTPANESSPSRA